MSVVFLEPVMRVSTWRTLWPAEELRRRGHDVRIFSQDSKRRGEIVMGQDTIVVHVTANTWAMTPDGTVLMTALDMCSKLREYGRLVVSFDDDLTRLLAIQPRGADGRVHPTMERLHSEVPAVARMASAVIVTTPRLAQAFGQYNTVAVCENYLPERYVGVEPFKPNGRLGWMGGMEVHDADLALLRPGAADLPPMHLIGTGKAGAELLRSWGAPDVTYTPTIWNQRRLYAEMGRCRAAVIPLVSDGRRGLFNLGKSWIKPMEFLAQGVPCIASPHPEYERLGVHLSIDSELCADARTIWEASADGQAPALYGILRGDRPGDEGYEPDYAEPGHTMEAVGGAQWEAALGLT